MNFQIFEESFELVDEADSVAVRDYAVLADHERVVGGQVVGHEAVVGAGHLQGQRRLLVLVMV